LAPELKKVMIFWP